MLTIARDITERKQAQQKLEELYRKESETRQALELQMRQRVEFTRALIHELKTPLTAVIASSEGLTTKALDEVQLRLARNIYRGACSLNSRIDELLDLAKGEIGVLKLRRESVDPLRILQKIVEEMTPEFTKKGQSLILEVPTSLPLVWADEERLQQILLNLISNALKFNRKNGKVTLIAKEEDTSVVFEVQDEGKGITKKDQQRLFRPYYRLESDRERLSGLGLGLALSKTLVELHQGQIGLRSQKGKGSTFAFSIPLKSVEKQGN